MDEKIIVQLIVAIIGAPIASLIGAIFVRLGTKLVCKFTPSYGMAYLASLLVILICAIIEFVGNLVLGAIGMVLSMIIGFMASSACYARIIKHPETGPIGFGKACLINLFFFLIGIGILFFFVLIAIVMVNI